MKKILLASIALTSLSVSAKNSDISLNVGFDYTNYSGEHGKRNVSFIELRNKLENGNAVFVQEQLSGITGISGYHQEQVWL